MLSGIQIEYIKIIENAILVMIKKLSVILRWYRYHHVLNNLARECQRRRSAGRGTGSLSWTSSKKMLEKARFPLTKT
jgi:hypothetical protein